MSIANVEAIVKGTVVQKMDFTAERQEGRFTFALRASQLIMHHICLFDR